MLIRSIRWRLYAASALVMILLAAASTIITNTRAATRQHRHVTHRRVLPAHRQVPFGFLGVMVDGPLASPSIAQPNLEREFAEMTRSGVESVRLGVYWSVLQPYADAASVPHNQVRRYPLAEGVPTDFAATDRLYAQAAKHGLRVLPVVLQAPAWARVDPARRWSPPADPLAYGRFVGLLVRRYGPHGAFWAQHPQLRPLQTHAWQIWNEPAGGATPNGRSVFWDDPEPFQDRFVAMLQAARAQIKASDPQGQVVLGGLFGRGWLALDSLYQHGVSGVFDAAAINIFTNHPSDVGVALQMTRAVLNAHGDKALPLLVTESSWPSAAGRVPRRYAYSYDVTEAKQAQRVAEVLRVLVASRGSLNLQGFYWYTWASADNANYSDRSLVPGAFAFAGLRRLLPSGKVVAKPAEGAYRVAAQRYEGCRKRATLATICLR